MSKKNYLEPNFYVVSDRLCYTIRGEVELGDYFAFSAQPIRF